MDEFKVDGDVIAEVAAYLNRHKTVPAKRMADAVLRLLNRHYQDAAALEADRRALQREGNHPAPCARMCEAPAFGIEIRQLKAALEAAREDGERLDWLDIQRGDDVRQDPHSGDPVLVAHYWAIEGQCTDIRQAIDQARGKGVA